MSRTLFICKQTVKADDFNQKVITDLVLVFNIDKEKIMADILISSKQTIGKEVILNLSKIHTTCR